MNFDIYVDINKLNHLIDDDKGINDINMIKIKVRDGEFDKLSTYRYSGVLGRVYKLETFTNDDNDDDELVKIENLKSNKSRSE